MTTFWLVMIFVFALGSAFSALMYNYYKDKSGGDKHTEVISKQQQIGDKIDSTKNEIVDEFAKRNKESESLILNKVDSSKEAIAKNLEDANKNIKDDIKKSTEKIINKVDASSTSHEKNQKEILGKLDEIKNPPKDSNGLYRDNMKWGVVKKFSLNEDGKTFTIDEVSFDNPLKPTDNIWIPFQYKNLILKFQKVETLVTFYPPMARGIEGIILGASEKK